MGENLREIINGGMIPQFIGKKVSVTGLVSNMQPNGLTFDLQATDNITVKVQLKKPNKSIEKGYVEVHGVAQGGNAIVCEDMVQFPLESSADFDAASHNTLCKLLHSVPDLYKTSN